MHMQNVNEIRRSIHSLLDEHEVQTDGRTMDGRTEGHTECKIPRHLRVAGYKNEALISETLAYLTKFRREKKFD